MVVLAQAANYGQVGVKEERKKTKKATKQRQNHIYHKNKRHETIKI